MVNIFCVNTQTTKTFQEGTTLMDMLPEFAPGFETPYPVIAAKVNNVCQGLKYRAFNSRQVEYLDYTSYFIYRTECVLQFALLPALQGCKGPFSGLQHNSQKADFERLFLRF